MALPCEMLDQILIRLPVKHLLRCRCVSKGWCSLIDSAPFIKQHLKTTIDYNAGGGSLLINGADGKFYLADFKAINAGDADDDATAVQIGDPLTTLLSGASIVGASNGLVCVHKNMMTELLIFNPATRESRKIPSMPHEFPRSFHWNESSLCGFGYDHLNDDYKVVKIAECYLQFRGVMVIVYSLKTNCWKRIHNVPSNTRFTRDMGVLQVELYIGWHSRIHHKAPISLLLLISGLNSSKKSLFQLWWGLWSVLAPGVWFLMENHFVFLISTQILQLMCGS